MTRESWPLDLKLRPIDTWHPVLYSRKLSKQELTVLVEGFVPREMDDHWFVFTEEDVVHLFRSWTGIQMFAIRLDRLPDGSAEIAEVRMNDEFRSRTPQRPQRIGAWLRRRGPSKDSHLSETEILDVFFASLTRTRDSRETLAAHVYGL